MDRSTQLIMSRYLRLRILMLENRQKFIKKNIYEDLPIKVEADANFEDV